MHAVVSALKAFERQGRLVIRERNLGGKKNLETEGESMVGKGGESTSYIRIMKKGRASGDLSWPRKTPNKGACEGV